MKNTKEKCKNKNNKAFLLLWWNLLRLKQEKQFSGRLSISVLYLYEYLLVHTSRCHLLQHVADMLLYRSTDSVAFMFDQWSVKLSINPIRIIGEHVLYRCKKKTRNIARKQQIIFTGILWHTFIFLRKSECINVKCCLCQIFGSNITTKPAILTLKW